MAPDAMVTISDVHFTYGGKETLKGITFDARAGEFIGLIGPNGSGKTTLMRCINSMLRPQKGTIIVDGKDVSKLKVKEVARICANVPADCNEDFNLSVQELVFLGRYPHVDGMWWESKRDESVVKETMHKFELDNLAGRKLSELSSGEKARALLAKAVVQAPKVLLADEPSAHLDLRYQLEVMERLRELSRQGVCVITVSHDMNLTSKYCDRVLMLDQGNIAAMGRPSEVITAERIRDVYGVEVSVFRDGDEIFAIPRKAIR
ncbi:MAG: Cobalamin import ATP-binding protein BtuD [Methanomassiliicoccales archaeon PtaU1.Bin124]|nr:MAG: Cobalamin import ATP-binding protein BtuD [Methanomassiliicoccales archaeon PtaU1.Bin124]